MYVFAVRLIACVVFGTAALSAIDASALALTGVKSRKVHAAAGPFDLAIDTTQAFGASVTVEPRTIGAGHVIVFQFDATITSTGTVTAVDGFGPVGTVSAAITGATNTPVNNEISVTLTGIPENKRVSIALSQVNGSLDVPAVSMGFLVGDVNNTRSANSSDISSVKARSGQSTIAATYLFDLNASGAVNSSDISAVKARSGLSLSAANEVSLLVSKAGTGAGVGSVSSVPAGINCGVTCAANFVQNTSVTVTASPIGSVFNGWSGACTGTGSTSAFVLAASSTCSANFTINTYAVTPSAGANGSINPLTVQTVNHGATASFTVTANSGFAADVVGTCGGILVGTTYTTNPVTAPCTVVATFIPAPLVIYTDILSGPNTGGENGKGIYLSIFGKNFGSTGVGTNIKVFINNVEVDNYRYLGPSKGRPDIQQITVQVGAISSPTPGIALPIRVVSQGISSNVDQTFTVLPGNIYFVAKTGADTNAGTFASPYRTVQKDPLNNLGTGFSIETVPNRGVWGLVRAGDFIVMRGGVWTDRAKDGYFMRMQNKSGCALGVNCAQGGGTTSGPIAIMGYPGEDVFINTDTTFTGAISAADTARHELGYGSRFTLTNLRIEGGGNGGIISTQAAAVNPLGAYWRVVNNELTAATAVTNPTAKGAGVSGSGIGNFWVGNHVHDVYDKPDGVTDDENHGYYVDGIGSYEIAYNLIQRIFNGNGVQLNSTSTLISNNANIHHNIIHDVGKHGINLAPGSEAGITVYNNVVYNTVAAGLRINSTDLVGAKIYNNTFYNTDLNNMFSPNYAALSNDDNLAAGSVDIRNNIIVPGNASRYFTGGSIDFDLTQGIFTNNLWFSGRTNGGGPVLGTANVITNPLFLSTTLGAENLRLQATSPALNSGLNSICIIVFDDNDIATTTRPRTARPFGAGCDIGAYEQ